MNLTAFSNSKTCCYFGYSNILTPVSFKISNDLLNLFEFLLSLQYFIKLPKT